MNLIWATRGLSWGFRFLLDGGYSNPLPAYERAFAGTEGQTTLCRSVDELVALRFPDPLGRRDEAGRPIPHDIVVLPPFADDVRSVDDGQRLVWPLLADTFARVWELPCRSRPRQPTSLAPMVRRPEALDLPHGTRPPSRPGGRVAEGLSAKRWIWDWPDRKEGL